MIFGKSILTDLPKGNMLPVRIVELFKNDFQFSPLDLKNTPRTPRTGIPGTNFLPITSILKNGGNKFRKSLSSDFANRASGLPAKIELSQPSIEFRRPSRNTPCGLKALEKRLNSKALVSSKGWVKPKEVQGNLENLGMKKGTKKAPGIGRCGKPQCIGHISQSFKSCRGHHSSRN